MVAIWAGLLPSGQTEYHVGSQRDETLHVDRIGVAYLRQAPLGGWLSRIFDGGDQLAAAPGGSQHRSRDRSQAHDPLRRVPDRNVTAEVVLYRDACMSRPNARFGVGNGRAAQHNEDERQQQRVRPMQPGDATPIVSAAHLTMGCSLAPVSARAVLRSTQRHSSCSGRPSSGLTGSEILSVRVAAR